MTPDTYRCARCRVVFEKGWSDEEADAEAQQTFGEIPPDERVVVCHDCYLAILTSYTRRFAAAAPYN